jgi:hypothetical protein
MMTRALALVVMVAFLVGLAAPVLAQQQQAPAASAPASSAPASSAPAAAPAAKAPAKEAAKEPAKAEVKKVTTKSANGMVKSASADSLVLVAGKDKKEWTFALGKDTKITKAGKAAKVEDLAAEDDATVAYVEQDGKMHAKSVRVKAKAMAPAKPKS